MEIYVVKGLFKKFFKQKPKSTVGMENFLDVSKSVFKRLNVPYADACCPQTSAPVRYNTALSRLEYLTDPANDTWVLVP